MNDEDQINLPILILCGGKGTRFKSTKLNTSKNIAPIGDSFFLDLIIDFYERQGFTNFILCLGYLSKEIISHVNKRLLNHNIKFSIENEPLGTGGAVYNAGTRDFSCSGTFISNTAANQVIRISAMFL